MIEETNQIKEDIPEGEADAKQLPEPSGYRILIALPKAEDTYESGIAKASVTQTKIGRAHV